MSRIYTARAFSGENNVLTSRIGQANSPEICRNRASQKNPGRNHETQHFVRSSLAAAAVLTLGGMAGVVQAQETIKIGLILPVSGPFTSKTGALEMKDDIPRWIDETAKFASLNQLCLSPQCGFASTQEGNTLAEDEPWKTLEMTVGIAHEVWG
jgi:hypothetical protein